MRKKITASFLAAALAVSMLFVPTAVFAAGSENTPEASGASSSPVSSKEEVIYSILNSDGSVKDVYSVNILEVNSAGPVSDYGCFSAVKNLTNTNTLDYSDGKVSVIAEEGKFYYQGDMLKKELPWTIDISYTLDGKEILASDLAGASGRLIMKINTARNKDVDALFFENYLLQVSVTLDTEKCKGITAENSTLANVGGSKLITFAVLPNKDGNMTVSADITDFEMTGISFSAVPFTMDLDVSGISEMTGGLSSLSNAISQLNDGISGLKNGASSLSEGASRLKSGSNEYMTGLGKLSTNSDSLTGASQKILEALQYINSSLTYSDTGSISLPALTALPAILSQLAGGLNDISGGLSQLSDGYSQALSALNSAILAIPETQLAQADIAAIEALMQSNPDSAAALNLLLSNYLAAQTAKGTYAAVSGALTAVRDNLPVLAASVTELSVSLNEISGQLSSSLEGMDIAKSFQALKNGIGELTTNYISFHEGLASYANGVKTAAGSYSEIYGGIAGISGGASELSGGIEKYAAGMQKLNYETSRLPEEIQSAVDDIIGAYDTSDFTPVSFVSSANKDVASVQFVIQTESIAKQKAESPAPAAEEETFLTRLKMLFTNN